MTGAAALRQDIIDELEWEQTLDAAGIRVAVNDGAVTLTGHVRSYADRRLAERAAKRVSGVVAVANELEVRIPGDLRRDDTDLAQAAAAALRWSVSVPDDVSASVERGWITLHGDVDWPYQRRAAENAIRDLTGVRGVSNLVAVREKPMPGDVKSRIRKAFQRSAQIDADHVRVEAFNGTVTLTGTVRTWSERSEAEHTARAAPGVTKVQNNLSVAGTPALLM